MMFVSCHQNVVLFDDNNKYLGFDNDEVYDLETSIKEDYVVINTLDIVENKEVLDDFIAHPKEDDVVRFAYFNEKQFETYKDLVYDTDGFSAYYRNQEDMTKQAYQYLLVLEGSFGNPLQRYKMIVLSDRESLTFDEVHRSMVSSSMEVINSIGSFDIVVFKYN